MDNDFIKDEKPTLRDLLKHIRFEIEMFLREWGLFIITVIFGLLIIGIPFW